MLTDLFDERMEGKKKVEVLENDYGLPMTQEVRKELETMCTYGAALTRKSTQRGLDQGLDQGLKALVTSLKKYITDFETLYKEVISNEEYAEVKEDDVRKYYQAN